MLLLSFMASRPLSYSNSCEAHLGVSHVQYSFMPPRYHSFYTSVSLWSHYSVLVNKSAAVFEHYLWHFFSESFQGFPALWDYRWGQLRMIYTALQRTVLVRLNTSYRNECHLGFHYISLAKGNFLKFTHRIFIRLLHFENFGPRHHGKIHTYSSSSDLYCHC